MATTSEVKNGLDEISIRLKNCRKGFTNGKDMITNARNLLVSINTDYSDPINEIGNYTGADQFELLCQAELSRLTTEFILLRNEINAVIAGF